MTPPLHPVVASCCQSPALRAAIEVGDVAQVIDLAWRCHGATLIVRFRRAGFSRADADEMLGGVMSLVFERWSSFDGGNLCGWLNALAKYEILTYRSRARRQRLQFEAEVEPAGSFDPIDARELREIAAIVEAVGEQQEGINRVIFAAVFEDKLAVAQVVRLLAARGTPLAAGAVSKRLSRMRGQIARRMAAAGLSNPQ